MDKDKIILKDGTILEIDQSSSTGEFCMTFANVSELDGALNKLSSANLEQYEVQNQAELTVATPTDKECLSCRLDLHRDDTGIVTTFMITNVDMTAKAIKDLQLALTDQYEQNLALEETVTDTQLAITEIYEGMGV